MEDNIERQQLEIEALESIYEDLNVTNNKGIVHLKIELEQPIQLNGNELFHLPPVKFKFKLVPSYPSTQPPLIQISSSWLTLEQLTVLGLYIFLNFCKKF